MAIRPTARPTLPLPTTTPAVALTPALAPALAPAMALALVLAACGGQDAPSPSTAAAGSSPGSFLSASAVPTASATTTSTASATAAPPASVSPTSQPAATPSGSRPATAATRRPAQQDPLQAKGADRFVAVVRAQLPEIARDRSARQVAGLAVQLCDDLAAGRSGDAVVARAQSLGTLDAAATDAATDAATARELVKLAIDTVCLEQAGRVDEF